MKKLAIVLALCMMLTCLFAGCAKPAEDAPAVEGGPAGLPNPMVEVSAEDFASKLGLSFGEVDNAGNVKYYIISDEIGEMQFTLDGTKLNARIKSASEFTDISGMFIEWDNTEDVTIGGREGKLMTGTTDGKTVEVCQWYDIAPGIMYSLTAEAADLDGFDITAVAEQVFAPMQGEVNG